jgi:hypothetical protein
MGTRQTEAPTKREADDLVNKAKVSTYFSLCNSVSFEFLPMGQKRNSQFFTETVLLSIDGKLAEYCPKLLGTAAHLHVNNATPPKCPLKKLKSWTSSWCLCHLIHPISQCMASFCLVT